MRKSSTRTLVIAVTFLIISALLLIANSLFGNPVSAIVAKTKAEAYIDGKYGHLNLEIDEVVYNPKNSSYCISVSSDTSVDTHFSLGYRDGAVYTDSYDISVLSGMNTIERLCREYEENLTPLVQANISDVTNISVMPEKLVQYDICLDIAFDKKLAEDVIIAISCTGGSDARYLSRILKATYDIMDENGYTAKEFGITGEHETVLTELRHIQPRHIEDEDLERLLQEAILHSECDGIIGFRKGQK